MINRKHIKRSADLIGRTPLLELESVSKIRTGAVVFRGRLEYFNPAGSVEEQDSKGYDR